jgi:AAA15 family ATPase/GTPase
MLNTLTIENFRLFRHLNIEGLKRVNLFAGKNNSGKTALLEALRIMAAEEELSVMKYILHRRGETMHSPWNEYDSFFHRPSFESQKDSHVTLKINDFGFSRIHKGERNSAYTLKSRTQLIDHQTIISFRTNDPLVPRDRLVSIPFSASEHFPLAYYWDQIVLTPKEDIVIKILQETILPDLIRLDVQQNERIMVRLKQEERPIPLNNLGDGAQRVLLMAIALVSAKDNILLIDEVETGLHYSILEKIWDIIFNYSEKLNVQVFATTHSHDAIKAFTYQLEKPENEERGAYFRLQMNRKTQEVEAIPFDLDLLETALESQSEIR